MGRHNLPDSGGFAGSDGDDGGVSPGRRRRAEGTRRGVSVGVIAALIGVVALVGGAILSLHPPGGMPVRQMWQPGVMANTYGTLAIVVFTNMLWLLPVISYALLASVIAKRSPLLTGLLPLVIAAAVERVVFGSTFLAGFLRERFMLVPGPEALATPGLWLGLAVAAGILYIVIRLRRYRDDS